MKKKIADRKKEYKIRFFFASHSRRTDFRQKATFYLSQVYIEFEIGMRSFEATNCSCCTSNNALRFHKALRVLMFMRIE